MNVVELVPVKAPATDVPLYRYLAEPFTIWNVLPERSTLSSASVRV